jgi:CubicO group peptidase (beta-lactamase class C family)
MNAMRASLLLVVSLFAAVQAKHPYTTAGVDHIMIGVADLDEGIRAFEQVTGVAAVRGGRHPSRGTENALVSLGGGAYIEIIAPQREAQPNEMVTSLRGLRAPALVGWAVHVVDANDAAARLGRAGFTVTRPQPGSRVTPQGGTLEWSTFNLVKPQIATAPFFIQWGASTTHPSVTSPGGCTLASFQVGDPAGDDLSRMLDTLGVKTDVRKAERAHMHLDLRCGARTASFHTPPEVEGSLGPDIDKAVTEILTKAGAPSASIAVVMDGRIVYEHAYGNARLDPPMAATPQMRYSIGSVSKQFTSTAILMLAEEGKLSLDDRVGKWLPQLTRAQDVTIRQLLSMTSGYQDYWPQDYVMPMMLLPVSATEIVKTWGEKPLDFEPGTKWQYSNTNYVMAGMIVERAAGVPLLDFLQKRIFGPLHMTSVSDIDSAPLGDADPTRYLRYALGPPRVAPKEGKGWLFAAGELAMTAHDLALWDIGMIDRALLRPESYRAMQTEVQLANGTGTRYGLGVGVGVADGRRVISHNGEVSGFTANNDVYADDRAAVVVLANIDANPAAGQIASRLSSRRYRAKFAQKALRITTFWMPDGKLEQFQIAVTE